MRLIGAPSRLETRNFRPQLVLECARSDKLLAGCQQIRSGARQILGVTKFRNANLGPIDVETVDGSRFAVDGPDPRKPGPDSACQPLKPVRLAQAFEGDA